jgi:hypothetical protein
LSTYKFQKASQEGSLDLDDMLLDQEDIDSSRDSVSHDGGGENDGTTSAER